MRLGKPAKHISPRCTLRWRPVMRRISCHRDTRIGQSYGASARDGWRKEWYKTAPVGALRKLAGKG